MMVHLNEDMNPKVNKNKKNSKHSCKTYNSFSHRKSIESNRSAFRTALVRLTYGKAAAVGCM